MTLLVRAVCRPEVAGGLALAGLPITEAATAQDAAETVAALRRQADVGLVLLEDALYDALPDEVQRGFGRRSLPMIVPFPGPRWDAPPEDAEAYIVELLRQVVGYRVRLR